MIIEMVEARLRLRLLGRSAWTICNSCRVASPESSPQSTVAGTLGTGETLGTAGTLGIAGTFGTAFAVPEVSWPVLPASNLKSISVFPSVFFAFMMESFRLRFLFSAVGFLLTKGATLPAFTAASVKAWYRMTSLHFISRFSSRSVPSGSFTP